MRTMYLFLLLFISNGLFACHSSQAQVVEPGILNKDSMKFKVTVGQTVLTATVYDNPTASDFVSLLPSTLTLRDYASTEKVSDLPKSLPLQVQLQDINLLLGISPIMHRGAIWRCSTKISVIQVV